MADIIGNPVLSDRRQIIPGKLTANGDGAKYGAVMVYDTSTTNFEDVRLPAAAGATAIAGVIVDQGDPNDSGEFATGNTVGLCREGSCEVLLAASAAAVKGAPCIIKNTSGHVGPRAAEAAPFQILGYFGQTKTAGAGGPELVTVHLNIQHVYSVA